MVYMLAAGHFRGVARCCVKRRSRIGARRGSVGRAPRAGCRSSRIGSARRMRSRSCCSRSTKRRASARRRSSTELFEQLRPAALATVFQWLRQIAQRAAAPGARGGGGRLAGANTAELVRLIQSPDRDVSLEAIRRAGSLKAQAAVLPLSQGAQRAGRRAPPARGAGAGRDRIAGRAAGARARASRTPTAKCASRPRARMSARAHRPALARLEAAVKGKASAMPTSPRRWRSSRRTARSCGDAGVALLRRDAQWQGISRPARGPEIAPARRSRSAASARHAAIEALRKAGGEKDVVVRNAVTRALRGGPRAAP